MARLECTLSEPPRRMAALPDFRHKRTGIAGHVGPALVDDADDAERHAHARDVEAVGPRPLRDDGADGIGQRGDFLDSACHRLDAISIEREAIEHGAGQALGARRLHVARVGR